MSMDKGLKSGNVLIRHRNVLTRDERIESLKEAEKWQDGQSILGLPKVANRKVIIKKEKVAKVGEPGAEGVAAAPGAAGAAAPAAAGKGEAKPAAKPAAKGK